MYSPAASAKVVPEFNPTFDFTIVQVSKIFFNSTDRLRSGWRASIYVLIIIVLSFFSGAFLQAVGVLADALGLEKPWVENLIEILSWVLLFAVAVFAGWGCAKLLEDLPWRALGWSHHKGAIRDFLVGSLIGVASILIATSIAAVSGGLRFKFFEAGAAFAVGKTLIGSGLLFILAAAGEEALFRGYALQTFTRAGLVWLGVFLTSVPFALVHLSNPNVSAGFTFVNTALAGAWLAAAYLRTRSLWFPLGIHWAWNWTMGSVFGIPVSGITKLTPHPFFISSDAGPSWLTGGAYGLEGGAACTVALIISTIFILRTKLVAATDEMIALTSHEIPKKNVTLIPESVQPPVSD